MPSNAQKVLIIKTYKKNHNNDSAISQVYTDPEVQAEKVIELFNHVIKKGNNECVRYLHACMEEYIAGNENIECDDTDNSDSDSECEHCGQRKPEKDETDVWTTEQRRERCAELLDSVSENTFEEWIKLMNDCDLYEKLEDDIHCSIGELIE